MIQRHTALWFAATAVLLCSSSVFSQERHTTDTHDQCHELMESLQTTVTSLKDRINDMQKELFKKEHQLEQQATIKQELEQKKQELATLQEKYERQKEHAARAQEANRRLKQRPLSHEQKKTLKQHIISGDDTRLDTYLKEQAVPATTTFEHGHTPLHLAVQHSCHACAQLLISHGTPINAANEAGHTPLHLAAAKGDLTLVTILCKAGASQNIHDAEGMRATDIARQAGYTDIVQRLASTT